MCQLRSRLNNVYIVQITTDLINGAGDQKKCVSKRERAFAVNVINNTKVPKVI